MVNRSIKVQDIVDKLRDLIPQLATMVGDKLPAERPLAQSLGCSRETLRRALGVLEGDGELWRHVGQGTFRGRRPQHAPLRDEIRVYATTIEEFVEARQLIEPIVAGQAAQRAIPADIHKLEACVRHGVLGTDSFECQKADDLFHRTIAEVAKNPILLSVVSYLSETRRRSLWQTQWDRTYRKIGIQEFKSEHSDQHKRIVNAIKINDREQAESAMRDHLITVKKVLENTPIK